MNETVLTIIKLGVAWILLSTLCGWVWSKIAEYRDKSGRY